jgi:thioredoxin 2
MQLDSSGVLMACSSCKAKNRIRFTGLDRATRCGKCQAALPLVNSPIEVVDADDFDSATQNASVPIVVDFWAAWCGPCRMVAPEIQKVAAHLAGKALVLKVDTDANAELSSRFRIQSIPTIAILHHGKEVNRAAGVRPAAAIEAMVPQLV